MSDIIGGWRRHSSRLVYDNPWIQVRHEEVTTPAQTPGAYGVIHFKNTAVGILPLDRDNNTYLVRQTRYPLGHYTWEIPEGGCPAEEAPLDAARRELQEEVGLAAGHWELLQQLHLSNSITDERAIIYLARDLRPVAQSLDESEDIEVLKLPLSRALTMLREGEITDAITVAALLRYALPE